MIDSSYLSTTCLLAGGAKQCRYLRQTNGCWNCLKLRKMEKKKIDDRIQMWISEFDIVGGDPYKKGYPIGDNCKGLPLLKHIKQP